MLDRGGVDQLIEAEDIVAGDAKDVTDSQLVEPIDHSGTDGR
jgi:hypothetical protein